MPPKFDFARKFIFRITAVVILILMFLSEKFLSPGNYYIYGFGLLTLFLLNAKSWKEGLWITFKFFVSIALLGLLFLFIMGHGYTLLTKLLGLSALATLVSFMIGPAAKQYEPPLSPKTLQILDIYIPLILIGITAILSLILFAPVYLA